MSIDIARITRTTDIQSNNPIFTRPARITFDSSYAQGGEAHGLPYTVLGAAIIAKNAEARKYNIEYDSTAGKFVVTEPQAPLIVREDVTVASDVATLQKIPGYIIAIEVTAGGVTGAFLPIPVGKTPTTKQVAVNLATGALTFLTADAVTAARFMYIPMGVGPFVEANRVIDEAVVFGSGAGDTFDLANRAGLIQYVWNNTASAANRLPAIQPVGESPSTNQIAIDINNSGATTITNNNAQDTNAGLVTYWKYSPLAAFGWTDQADIAATSNAIVLAEVLDLGGIVIPGFGCVLVCEDGTTNKQPRIIGPGGTAATDVAVYDPAKGTITFDSGDSIDTCEIPYLVLSAALFDNVHAEVPAGRDLSGVVVDVMLYMRRA